MSFNKRLQLLVQSPQGVTVSIDTDTSELQYCSILDKVLDKLFSRQQEQCQSLALSLISPRKRTLNGTEQAVMRRQKLHQSCYLVHNGRLWDPEQHESKLLPEMAVTSNNVDKSSKASLPVVQLIYLQLKYRLLGGMDRQNRVGSKFGGGGVSSAQQSERERKERLKRLALESIDLAKDPYLVRNHLGSYECKLCLTLHRDEANYLAHTQGKKHQHGLARRAHLEKLKQERDGTGALPTVDSSQQSSSLQPATKKIRIGRPAYQVFKSRDPDTNQRCLSFELQYPEIEEDLQPRHRFMSAYEQRIERPPDGQHKPKYQYLLFAADPYETVAFKIPNEAIDKGEDRFVTHWDSESKRFTLTLYFVDEVPKDNKN